LRVLDLTARWGNYCGKLFADLGADVILIEPPGGSPLRRVGPFIDDKPSLEGAIPFLYHNTNKRSLVTDLDTPHGQSLLKRLIATADLLIETESPGTMEARGLSATDARRIKPSLVYTSITPFGRSGPFAHYAADDLTLMAMGGLLTMAGYPDQPPITAYGEQAFAASSLYAAVASLLAVYRAEATAVGETIDVSIQESVAMGLENAAQLYDLQRTIRRREAGVRQRAGSGLYPCQDGYVYMLAGGIGETKFWSNFLDWLTDEKVEGVAVFREERWLDIKFLTSEEGKKSFSEIFDPFALTRSKANLYEGARRWRVPMAPVATPANVLASAQLRHRGFFVDVHNGALNRDITLPGAPYKLSDSPWRIRLSAPRLGAHTEEILSEMALNEGVQQGERRVTA
jgi:benzylsuccinate CoA-transferase BbsE subunit